MIWPLSRRRFRWNSALSSETEEVTLELHEQACESERHKKLAEEEKMHADVNDDPDDPGRELKRRKAAGV